MRIKQFIVMLLLLGAALYGRSQNSEVILRYIDAYKELAVAEMLRTGVPASIKLAQGIHETMAGTSELVKKSNNHFGIKCKASWTGQSVSHDDDLRNECFRKYDDPRDSYKDHSDFLKGSPRYASLFSLDPLDYKDWAYGLKKAGYATNPKYPALIIKLIETYRLQDYSLVALGKLDPAEVMMARVSVDKEKNGQSIAGTEPIAGVATKSVAMLVNEEPEPQYPPGEFRINDTRVIYARKGSSFLAIAREYGVPLARIFEFNEMKETESLERNQLIYLQRKRRVSHNQFHIVKAGETLADIARVEAIRLEALLEYNHLGTSARPAVGEQLYLYKKAPAMPKLETKMASITRSSIE